MKAKKVSIEQFEVDCLKVIKHYRTDLGYDLEIIAEKRPALLFAYEHGSHAIELRGFERYPARGERVPYLFGTADRNRILNETGSTLQCESVKNSPLVHHFDGTTIRRIDHAKAAEIVDKYKRDMRQKFNPSTTTQPKISLAA